LPEQPSSKDAVKVPKRHRPRKKKTGVETIVAKNNLAAPSATEIPFTKEQD
jgi:hypothetical protein